MICFAAIYHAYKGMTKRNRRRKISCRILRQEYLTCRVHVSVWIFSPNPAFPHGHSHQSCIFHGIFKTTMFVYVCKEIPVIVLLMDSNRMKLCVQFRTLCYGLCRYTLS
jgi:hypothetical protein